MANKYQDFSYNYTHNLYTKKHKIYDKTTQTKKQKKHTHTVLSLDSSSNQQDTSIVAGKIVECDGRSQLFKLRIVYQQYII